MNFIVSEGTIIIRKPVVLDTEILHYSFSTTLRKHAAGNHCGKVVFKLQPLSFSNIVLKSGIKQNWNQTLK